MVGLELEAVEATEFRYEADLWDDDLRLDFAEPLSCKMEILWLLMKPS